jgi:uncharacterized membrane protein
MKTKNFLMSGLAGGITYFLLGWLFYGMLLVDVIPQPPEQGAEHMFLIFLGSITFGLFLAYIYTKWALISTAATGAQAGAVIGIFLGLFWNFFNAAMSATPDYQNFAIDVVVTVIMSAVTGAIVALVNGKMG